MSPEQARGSRSTSATDIWAFGCVLYRDAHGPSGLRGRDGVRHAGGRARARAGLVGAAGRHPPIRSAAAAALPREGSASDGCAISATCGSSSNISRRRPRPRRPSHAPRAGPWLLLAAGALAAGLGLGWLAATSITGADNDACVAPGVPRDAAGEPEVRGRQCGTGSMVAMSPDGQTLAYVAAEAGEARSSCGRSVRCRRRHRGSGSREPFFSPDSRWIGFRVGRCSSASRVQGGPAETIANLPPGTAAVHRHPLEPDDTLLVGAGPTGLIRARIGSGTNETLVKPAAGGRIMYPHALPVGRPSSTRRPAKDRQRKIVLLDLASRIVTPLRAGLAARYLRRPPRIRFRRHVVRRRLRCRPPAAPQHACAADHGRSRQSGNGDPASSPSPIPAHRCICRPSVRGER